VAARSKTQVCGLSLFGIAGSSQPEGMVARLLCCDLSGKGLCDGLIPRPEESY
jgi:hypothetical protein